MNFKKNEKYFSIFRVVDEFWIQQTIFFKKWVETFKCK